MAVDRILRTSDIREAICIGNGIDASEEGDDDKGGAVRETVYK